MANNHDRDRADTILLTAVSKKKKNVFFIGPYGRRLSFASQQRRALNVVWALTQSEYWPEEGDPRVAVVGGGIAGVMAAAALIMKNCSVALFEKEKQILKLQDGSYHRTVHPSINFWPKEAAQNRILRATTELPFFDWYPATAQKIVRVLAAEWECFKDHLSNIPGQEEVIDYRWDKKTKKVIVKLNSGHQEPFDLVIITSGFGKEKDLGDSNQCSYWIEDGIDEVVREDKRYLVSGTGDGGLIDVLRLLYPDFMTAHLAARYLE